MSAPPSLAASRESLYDPRGSRSATPVNSNLGASGKRLSADPARLDELDLSGQQVSHHAQMKGKTIEMRRIGYPV